MQSVHRLDVIAIDWTHSLLEFVVEIGSSFILLPLLVCCKQLWLHALQVRVCVDCSGVDQDHCWGMVEAVWFPFFVEEGRTSIGVVFGDHCSSLNRLIFILHVAYVFCKDVLDDWKLQIVLRLLACFRCQVSYSVRCHLLRLVQYTLSLLWLTVATCSSLKLSGTTRNSILVSF